MIKFNVVSNEGGRVLTVLVDGDLKPIDESHPRFNEIYEGVVLHQDESVLDLIDLTNEVVRQFERLSDNVTLDGGVVRFSGDPVDETISNLIVRFLDDGVDDWEPLVLFLEKLYTNVDAGVRENLFRWISNRDLTITDKGNVLGYKGVRTDYGSVTAGPGVVNDVPQNGHLDNTPGNVLEMARSAVENNPSVACSTGLHVGSRSYATSFGYRVVVVEVDPQHVVSVPYDCNGEKMRVSKYVVLEDAADSYGALHVTRVEDVEDDEEYDWDTYGELDDEEYEEELNVSSVSSVTSVNQPTTIGRVTVGNLQGSFTNGSSIDVNAPAVKYDVLGRPIPPRGPDGKFIKK